MPSPTDTASADRIAALEAENAALKQQHLEFAEQQRREKAAAAHAAHVAFCEGLIKAGRLLPAQKSVAVAVLDTLSAADSVIEFGEGESKKPLIEAVKLDLLSALPKQVEFAEVGAGGGGQAAHALSAEQAAVCRNMGISEDDYRKQLGA